MLISGIPYKFATPWGVDATTGFVTNPIPATVASGQPAASQQLGFPPVTAILPGGGGTPPNINDFNGAFFYLSSWAQWQQAGGPIRYDSTFSGNVGGYPNGAVLGSTTDSILWQSTADNNTTNPDGGSPANWISLTQGRLIRAPQIFTTVGNTLYTPPSNLWRADVEVMSGGGGGGGCAAPGSGQSSVSCAGQGGNYGRGTLTAAQIAAVLSGGSLTVTVGAAGTGGTAGGTQGGNGGAGGQSSFSTLIVQPGGGVGGGGGLYSSTATVLPLSLTVASTTNCWDTETGSIPVGGTVVWFSTTYLTTVGSFGGKSRLGGIAPGAGLANGVAAGGWGAGGGATAAPPSAPSGYTGGPGTQGIVIVREYSL